ncbi:hypothetical protein KC354_g1521 [Hortaea werneckii]|nr:hypothetical protein KC354_g1521 [Hortaea werneckii]
MQTTWLTLLAVASVATTATATAIPIRNRPLYSGTCILNNDNPAPGRCEYSPDEGVVLSPLCDPVFPCPNNGNVCQFNTDDPTGRAVCS